MLSLIVPLARRLPGGALGRQRALGRRGERAARRAALRAGLPPAAGRGRLLRDRGRGGRGPRDHPGPDRARQRDLRRRALLRIGARRLRQRLAARRCSAPGSAIVATGFSLRTSVVTGSVAGVLVAMYIVDLVGRLDPSLDWIRYALGVPLLRQRDRGRHRPALLRRRRHSQRRCWPAVGSVLFERRDLTV